MFSHRFPEKIHTQPKIQSFFVSSVWISTGKIVNSHWNSRVFAYDALTSSMGEGKIYLHQPICFCMCSDTLLRTCMSLCAMLLSQALVVIFAAKVMTSYSSNWFSLLLLCYSTPFVLRCDRFNHGPRQVKREPVDLVTGDYDVSLCQQIIKCFYYLQLSI